ncbi:hypothetical protein [Marinimicrobium sp. ARAG 43.8]|uniref:hypothetical protein n=1 Tax=Marinimicrobium sp. ARAG 43.8 TaxID=3418719 RepID=UPI003CF7315C
MKKIALIVIVILVAVFGAQAITYAVSDVVRIKLRQHTFLIPKHIAMERESVMPDWLLNMSGLDDGSSTTLFKFDDQEIKANVTGYQVDSDNQFKDDVEGLIIALTSEEVGRYKDPSYAQLSDLWQRTGSYKNRKVEAAEMPGWYKVYRAVEYPNSWALLSRFPNSDKPIPDQPQDFWIASCLMQGPEGKRNGRCRTYELIDDIAVEFSISDYNLHLLDEIREFIRSQVREWKQ